VKKKGAKIQKKESIFIKEFLIRETACFWPLSDFLLLYGKAAGIAISENHRLIKKNNFFKAF
jgi:hypothetical protein